MRVHLVTSSSATLYNMPSATPIAYATLSNGLPSKPYILDITPSSGSPHLLLRHPASEITIADNQTLQPIDQLRGGHTGLVSAIVSDQGAIWSAGKEGNIVRWDERSRTAGLGIKGLSTPRMSRLIFSLCQKAITCSRTCCF